VSEYLVEELLAKVPAAFERVFQPGTERAPQVAIGLVTVGWQLGGISTGGGR
jgi:hypothetical protein